MNTFEYGFTSIIPQASKFSLNHFQIYLITQLCLFTTILTDEFNHSLILPANLIV